MLLLLNVYILSALRLSTWCLAHSSCSSICLRLLRPCVSSRVCYGHVAHVDVNDNILPNEITN